MLKIRKAEVSDLKDILRIYNQAVTETVATFDTGEKTVDEMRKWFDSHGLKNPIFVAELSNNIIGWAALSKYSDKQAYSDTAEISLYILEDHQGKGFGKKIMNRIIEEGRKAGLHSIIARITKGNQISIHLHEQAGFRIIGLLKEVGYKFGKRLDVYIMQKIYN